MEMLTPRQAALRLGISYPTVKQWIYRRKLRSVQTPGGHHRIPVSELDRYLHAAGARDEPVPRGSGFRRISGRNQLVGRVVEVKVSGLLAQVKLSFGGQVITAIITAEACREMGLKSGQRAAALVKATEVMIARV